MPLSKEGEAILAALLATPEGGAIVAIYNDQPRYTRRQVSDIEAFVVVERLRVEHDVNTARSGRL